MIELIEAGMNSYDGYDFTTQESPESDSVDADADKNVVLVPDPTRDLLNERQLVDYRHHREELVT